MAAPVVMANKHGLEDPAFPSRKRFKTSELPLNSAQRSSIDGLLHTIKKKGEYDTLRKQVWSQFIESEQKRAFSKSLNELAEAEIDRDTSLLSRDRGKAATLMQGAVDRSDIYQDVEKALDELISRNMHHIITVGREIRVAEVGEDVAGEEQNKGSRTDEQYEQEAAVKRQERIRLRKQEETRKRREEEKELLRAQEAEKLKELEKLRSQDEKRKEREAIRAAREAELERRKRKIMPSKEEPEQKVDTDTNKDQIQDLPAESPSAAVPPVDEKALEEAALALLLQEGREAAARNAPKAEPEFAESPHRKPHISPPKGPAAMRARDPVKPRLAYNSATPMQQGFQGSPFQPPSFRDRSRSPHHRDRSRSPSASHSRRHSVSIREDEPSREYEDDCKRTLSRDQRHFEADHPFYRDEDDYGERRQSRVSTHSRDDRVGNYDYDHDYRGSRESYSHRRDDRRDDRHRERGRYEDRSSYKRLPREEAPEHIDRYVPGGARPRDKDKDRDRDRDRDHRRDGEEHEAPREPRRERSTYYDTDRERQYYKKEADNGRGNYRESHHRSERPRDRDRDGYRERNRHSHSEHSHVRPRTDEPPEHIDRYVPGK